MKYRISTNLNINLKILEKKLLIKKNRKKKHKSGEPHLDQNKLFWVTEII